MVDVRATSYNDTLDGTAIRDANLVYADIHVVPIYLRLRERFVEPP